MVEFHPSKVAVASSSLVPRSIHYEAKVMSHLMRLYDRAEMRTLADGKIEVDYWSNYADGMPGYHENGDYWGATFRNLETALHFVGHSFVDLVKRTRRDVFLDGEQI